MLKAAASTHGNFNKWCPELVLITVCSQETKFQRNSPKMSKSNLHSTEDKAQAFSNGCNPSPFLKSLRHIFLAKNSLSFFNDHLIACILLERLWQILCATSLIYFLQMVTLYIFRQFLERFMFFVCCIVDERCYRSIIDVISLKKKH